MIEPARVRGPLRASWYAVGVMHAVLVGGGLFFLAVSWLDFCVTLFCEAENEQPGWLITAVLLCALAAFVSAPVVAAWLSGWRRPVWTGLGSFVAFLVVFAIGAAICDDLFDDVGPAIVAGLAVEGSFAVRPPSLRAVRARLLTTVAIVLVSTVFTAADLDLVVAVLILLTLASVAVADTLALRNERSAST
jgi:hypothetical protein